MVETLRKTFCEEWRDVLKHAGYVMVAALLTYLAQYAGAHDMGAWTPLIMLALSAAAASLAKAGYAVAVNYPGKKDDDGGPPTIPFKPA